jgi:hypothetical protein
LHLCELPTDELRSVTKISRYAESSILPPIVGDDEKAEQKRFRQGLGMDRQTRRTHQQIQQSHRKRGILANDSGQRKRQSGQDLAIILQYAFVGRLLI